MEIRQFKNTSKKNFHVDLINKYHMRNENRNYTESLVIEENTERRTPNGESGDEEKRSLDLLRIQFRLNEAPHRRSRCRVQRAAVQRARESSEPTSLLLLPTQDRWLASYNCITRRDWRRQRQRPFRSRWRHCAWWYSTLIQLRTRSSIFTWESSP